MAAEVRLAVGKTRSGSCGREIGATLSASSTTAAPLALGAGSGTSSLALAGLPGCKPQVER